MTERVFHLEVLEGVASGQTVSVRDDSRIVVGRLEDCDLCIPDPSVSRQHFQIDVFSSECQMITLSKTGETLVNRKPASRIRLQSGDEIEFGDGNLIRLVIEEVHGYDDEPPVHQRRHVYHDEPPVYRDESAVYRDEPPVKQSRNAPDRPSAKLRVSTEATTCGLTLYQNTTAEIQYDEILELLSAGNPVYAIFDPGRLGCSAPPELGDVKYLFHWLDSPVREQVSPYLVCTSDYSIGNEIIHTNWGKDGMVCFSSKLDAGELFDHWSHVLGTDNPRPGAGVTAYHWPSLLDLILTCQPEESTKEFLKPLDWLFIESPKSAGNWHLFGDKSVTETLVATGRLLVEPAGKSQ